MKRKSFVKEETKRIFPNLEVGLTREQVEERKLNGDINIADNPTNKSYFLIILSNIFTPFNILMFVIAILLVLIVGPKVLTNLMFLVIILCNVLIGTIQECKSKRTVEKLKLLNSSKIKVKRDRQIIEILPSEIVLDDVIILYPGDQIPADCLVLEDDTIEINESLLTGESVAVKKKKGDVVYAGSFVVSGSLAIIADKIGSDTYLHSIESKAKEVRQPKSRLMIALRRIIFMMAAIAIPLAVAVFVNELLHSIRLDDGLSIYPTYWGEDSSLTSAVFYGGTTIAYMIPSGMTLLASVAMATGVVKLANTNTLAQDLYAVESLSRVDTLCLDKTGTLTDGTMTVEDYEIIDKKYDKEKVEEMIANFLSSFKTSNQTSTALSNRFTPKNDKKAKKVVPFSSSRKYSAVEFEEDGTWILGAPEYLTKDQSILDKVSNLANNGLRVVLFAHSSNSFKDDNVLPNDREIVSMFIIRDTIRPEVKETMEWFSDNDVDIKVISGDNVATVSYIAKCSGISDWDLTFDMSTLKEGDDLEEIVLEHAIFGRVTPDQKAEIIKILKDNGRVTGVTGDGLNDLLAFKQADCSIALANGAAATKNVANLILLDSNFANMKEAVYQGRRVVNNIQRSSSLFVMKDFLWFFITIMPILLGVQHIIQPTVMTIVSVFITGIASLFVALEPDKTRVQGNFFFNVINRAFASGLFMFLPILGITLYFIISSIVKTGTFDINLMKTTFENGEIVSLGWIPVMSLCVTIAGFVIFFENCRPFTRFRKILYFAILGVVIFVLYLIPEFFVVSGTEMMKETGGLANLIPYIFSHIGKNAALSLFRKMNLEQGLFLLIYFLLAYPLYLFNTRIAKSIAGALFLNNRLKDDEGIK